MLQNKKQLEKINTLAKNSVYFYVFYYIFIKESDFNVGKTN